MHRGGRAGIAVALAVLSLGVRGVAIAQEAPRDPSADALIEHGVVLREQGHDDLALVEFQRAFTLDPSPRARAQLGLVEQALGHWGLAEQHLAVVLATSGDPWVEVHREVLARAAAAIAQHLGSLDVSGGPAGAEVVLDGAVAGALPLAHPLRVETGPRLLEVRLPGYYPVLRTLVIAAGATSREAVALVPLAAPGAPYAVAPPVVAPAVMPAAPPSTVQRTVSFVGFAAAGALVVTGAVGLVERESAVSAYNADSTCLGVGASQSSTCAGRISAASTWGAVSVVSFVAAGVVAAGSTALILTAPRSSARGVACRGGLGQVACELRF